MNGTLVTDAALAERWALQNHAEKMAAARAERNRLTKAMWCRGVNPGWTIGNVRKQQRERGLIK